jgi:hypothetical protein
MLKFILVKCPFLYGLVNFWAECHVVCRVFVEFPLVNQRKFE